MAIVTLLGSAPVLLMMAVVALQTGVRSLHDSNGNVLEFTGLPGYCSWGMAGFALQAKIGRCVSGINGGLKCCQMTPLTLGGSSGKLGFRLSLVAGLAIQCGVHTAQGESTVFMNLQNVRADGPAFGVVAPLAIKPQRGFMNIGVAVRATGSHKLKG